MDISEGVKSENQVQPKRRWWLWVILILLLLCIIAYFGIGGYAISELTTIGEHPRFENSPASCGTDFENIAFKARGDDTRISAWYLPMPGSDRVMILVHGRDANKRDAVSGIYVLFACDLRNAGYAVLMIDLRGHGDSEGDRYSFGVYERRDVLGAVDWLRDHGYENGHIGAHGLSMGTLSIIGAAAVEPSIEILTLESTFADLYPLILEQWTPESGLPNWFLPGVFVMNRILYGYSLRDVRPVDELPTVAPRPVMIIQCTTDEIIKDIDLAYQLAASLSYTVMETFDQCEHADIYRDYPERYSGIVTSFLEANWR